MTARKLHLLRMLKILQAVSSSAHSLQLLCFSFDFFVEEDSWQEQICFECCKKCVCAESILENGLFENNVPLREIYSRVKSSKMLFCAFLCTSVKFRSFNLELLTRLQHNRYFFLKFLSVIQFDERRGAFRISCKKVENLGEILHSELCPCTSAEYIHSCRRDRVK